MKNIPIILAMLVSMSACSTSSSSGSSALPGACIPEEYLVSDSAGPGEAVDSSFDSDDNPFSVRMLIPAEQVAHEVVGYSPAVKVRTSQLRQSLYIIFDRVRHYNLPVNSSVEPFRGYENLQKLVTDDPFSWDVLELSDEGAQRWGDCADDYSGSFECWRVLQLEEFQLTYKIRPENLALYKAVDSFVIDAITNCDNVRE